MDVITAHQNGITNVVASMGTAVTERQLNDLKKLTKNIVLAMDADTAGEEAMIRLFDYENSLDIELKVVVLPEGEDPDSVIKEDTGKWKTLLDAAIPVTDFIFDVVSSQLDLSKTGDKRLAVERLGPVITAKRNSVLRAHYMQKLARLVGVDERTIVATLDRTRTGAAYRKPAKEAPARTTPLILSRPVEEQFLAFLLQHPEFREESLNVPAEYFENSENREIFTAWQQVEGADSPKENLDSTLQDYYDTLANKNILATKADERYNDYVLRLREEYLKGLARKGEMGRTPKEFPGEKDIELTDGLREVFNRRARRDGKGDKR